MTAFGRALGGHDHRGDRRLGIAVHVGGPVQQLGGRDRCGISPRKASSTSRLRSTVPGMACWKPGGGS